LAAIKEKLGVGGGAERGTGAVGIEISKIGFGPGLGTFYATAGKKCLEIPVEIIRKTFDVHFVLDGANGIIIDKFVDRVAVDIGGTGVFLDRGPAFTNGNLAIADNGVVFESVGIGVVAGNFRSKCGTGGGTGTVFHLDRRKKKIDKIESFGRRGEEKKGRN